MFQEVLITNTQRLINYLAFARAYFMKQNFIKDAQIMLSNALKDFFNARKKLKMAQYRVNYQRHKLRQMEELIAENNEHVFLHGNRLNFLR